MESLLARQLDELEQLRAEQARALHGELGGLLTAARIVLATLGTAPPADAYALLDQHLGEALVVKQRVVEALRPGLLDHFGPGVALVSRFETVCRQAGVSFEADVPFGLPCPAPHDGIVLYRIGEAALDFALAEAARAVHLSARVEGGEYRLWITSELPEGRAVSSPTLDRLVPWISLHGGGLRCYREGGGCRVEAAVPLR